MNGVLFPSPVSVERPLSGASAGDSFYPQKPQAPPLMPAEAYPEWSFSPPEKAKQADAWYGSGDVPGGYSEQGPPASVAFP